MRRATVVIQAAGFAGVRPSEARASARSNASCTASSASSRSPVYRETAPRMRGASERYASSILSTPVATVHLITGRRARTITCARSRARSQRGSRPPDDCCCSEDRTEHQHRIQLDPAARRYERSQLSCLLAALSGEHVEAGRNLTGLAERAIGEHRRAVRTVHDL